LKSLREDIQAAIDEDIWFTFDEVEAHIRENMTAETKAAELRPTGSAGGPVDPSRTSRATSASRALSPNEVQRSCRDCGRNARSWRRSPA
jgi:hypothetical protein